MSDRTTMDFNECQWSFTDAPRVMGDSPDKKAPEYGWPLINARVTCGDCQHTWTAIRGSDPGEFMIVQGPTISCPSCGAVGDVPLSP